MQLQNPQNQRAQINRPFGIEPSLRRLATILCLSALHLPAATIVWTNTAGGNWSGTTNWDPNQVPGQMDGVSNLDDVFITNAGTYSVTFDVGVSPDYWSVRSLTLGSGDTNGVQTLAAISKKLQIESMIITNGGVFSDNGSSITAAIAVENGGRLNSVNGTYFAESAANFPSVAVTSGGQAAFRGNYGTATLHGNASVENGGTFVIQGGISGSVTLANDAALTIDTGGTAKFQTIAGPYGSEVGVMDIHGRMTNSGTFNVNSGTVHLFNYGATNDLGFLLNLPGGTVNLSGGSSVSTALYAGSNDKFVNQGTVVGLSGNGNYIAVSDFDTRAGMVSNLTYTLSLGSFLGKLAGRFDAAAGAAIRFNGGTFATPLTPGNPLVFGRSGAYQFASGWLDLPTNIVPGLQMVGGFLEVEPTFQGGSITNLALNGITFTNSPDTVWSVTNGTFGVTNSAVYANLDVLPGAELDVFQNYTGSSTLHDRVTVETGAVMVASGTFDGPVTINGLCRIIASDITPPLNGSMTVGTNGTLEVVNTQFAVNSPLTNFGTINLYANYALGIDNDGNGNRGGLINEPGARIYLLPPLSTGIYRSGYSNQKFQDYFVNDGEVINSSLDGVIFVTDFTNAGSIFCQQGTLQFFDQYGTPVPNLTLLPSGSLNVRLNSSTDYGHIAFKANAALDGTIGVEFNTGFVPAYDTPFTVLSYPSYSGGFTGLDLPPSFDWQRIYGPTAFTLVPRREFTITPAGTTNVALHVSVLPGTTFTVLSCTNLPTSLAQWTPVVTNTENASGYFDFTNAADLPKQFFILRFP